MLTIDIVHSSKQLCSDHNLRSFCRCFRRESVCAVITEVESLPKISLLFLINSLMTEYNDCNLPCSSNTTYRVHQIKWRRLESCDILIRRSGVPWRVFFSLDFNKQYTGFAYENLLALSKAWVLRNRSYSGTRNRKNDSTFPQEKNKQWRTTPVEVLVNSIRRHSHGPDGYRKKEILPQTSERNERGK